MAVFNLLMRPELKKLSGIRYLSSKPKFGLLFDIDGVLVRGRTVLPPVRKAFEQLCDKSGNFRIPTVFVTNSGNALRSQKAADLSKWIGFKVSEEQVVMAHSPLSAFARFHDKEFLVSGQGPTNAIAKELGFNKVKTIDELAANFPSLDYVDITKRNPRCGPVDPNFPRIEGIVMFGEPRLWETSLQLMIDLLITNGMPSAQMDPVPYPHIPILACNMDLLWVAEAPIHRFGHGAYLNCLENVYKKITGKPLIYTALVGKPGEITYRHANRMILQHAKSIGISHNIDTIYAVGDNINTDVFGANLYDKYLSSGKTSVSSDLECDLEVGEDKAKACISILVETGVHKRDSIFVPEHSPRDFLSLEEGLCKPAFVVDHVGSAIDLAFREEKFN